MIVFFATFIPVFFATFIPVYFLQRTGQSKRVWTVLATDLSRSVCGLVNGTFTDYFTLETAEDLLRWCLAQLHHRSCGNLGAVFLPMGHYAILHNRKWCRGNPCVKG